MCSWRTVEYIDNGGEVVALCTDYAGVVDKCHDSGFIREVQSQVFISRKGVKNEGMC